MIDENYGFMLQHAFSIEATIGILIILIVVSAIFYLKVCSEEKEKQDE